MAAFSRKTNLVIVLITITSSVLAANSCMKCNPFKSIRRSSNPFIRNSRRISDDVHHEPSSHEEHERGPSKKSKCCPYDFDPTFCRVVGDRWLCGYNKNVGHPAEDDEIEKLSGDCRIRGGRLECGYEEPPWPKNARRPPVWDNPDTDSEEAIHVLEDEANKLKGKVETIPTTKRHHVTERLKSTRRPYRVTRCVETSDTRIVCREV